MKAIAAVFYRDYRQRMTNIGFVFWDLLAPLAYLTLFGLGFERMIGSALTIDGVSLSYTAFLLPGVLAMVTFSIAMNTSWGFFMDKDSGIFYADVTLVGNDTGGALCQITAADHPERIGRLVLTNCDAYRNFLPPAFRPLQLLPRIPGAMWLTGRVASLAPVRAIFNVLTTDPIPADLYADWTGTLRADAGVRRDVGKVLRGITPRDTMRAIEVLRRADRPTLIVWGDRDRFFAPEFARRLAADIPGARLEWIDGARTFTPLDAPEVLARHIAEFAAAGVPQDR